MCIPQNQQSGGAPDSTGVPPVIPLADAKADALRGDESTMERMGEKLGSIKRTEMWDKTVSDGAKEKALQAALTEFEKQKRKELGLR